MGEWIIGLVIFWGLVVLINSISTPVDKSMTEEDYKNLQRKWAEEDLEEERYNDYLESIPEIEMEKEKELAKNNPKKDEKWWEMDDLPF